MNYRVLKSILSVFAVYALVSWMPFIAEANSAISCHAIFSQQSLKPGDEINQELVDQVKLRVSAEALSQNKDQLFDMGLKLIEKNLDQLVNLKPDAFDLEQNSSLASYVFDKSFQRKNFELVDARVWEHRRNFHLVAIKVQDVTTGLVRNVYYRTNGHVAFLDKSWLYRATKGKQAFHSPKKYKALYLRGEEILAVDQGELIIASLGKSIEMSRTLGAKERKLWFQGKNFESLSFGSKVHFGLGLYKFVSKLNSGETYRFVIDRNFLLQAYRENLIEINTYDPIMLTDYKYPVNAWDMPALGIEVEVVFMGPQIKNILGPIMAEQLKSEPIEVETKFGDTKFYDLAF